MKLEISLTEKQWQDIYNLLGEACLGSIQMEREEHDSVKAFNTALRKVKSTAKEKESFKKTLSKVKQKEARND